MDDPKTKTDLVVSPNPTHLGEMSLIPYHPSTEISFVKTKRVIQPNRNQTIELPDDVKWMLTTPMTKNDPILKDFKMMVGMIKQKTKDENELEEWKTREMDQLKQKLQKQKTYFS